MAVKDSLLTKAFWVAALERAVKTFAQTLVGLFVGDSTVTSVNWTSSLVVAATAAVVSLATSVASLGSGPTGSPSLVTDPNAVND